LSGTDVKANVAKPWVLRIGGLVAGLTLTACGTGPAGSDGPAPSTTAPTSAAGTRSTTTLRSGVEGTLRASPTCPVQRADQPCAARPVDTDVRVIRGDGTVAARTHSGADGRFRVDVTPGRYRLEADHLSGPGRGCTPVDVVVEAGGFTHADIECDTGIR
jgi:hypothetical protein